MQWRGYESTVGRYQGEILNKATLHERFHQQLSHCEQSPDRIQDFDWSGIRLILDTLRSAFHVADAEELLEFELRRGDSG